MAEIIAAKTVPYCDPRMLDFSDDNLYSEHMARTTAWLLHYSLFWKQSCGLCDNAFADFLNPYGEGNRGLTPEGETRFLEAVTGRGLDFAESMEIGSPHPQPGPGDLGVAGAAPRPGGLSRVHLRS